jgi:hypothetical protein
MPIQFLRLTFTTDISQKGLSYDEVKDTFEFQLYRFSCLFFAFSGLVRIHQKSYIDGFNLIIQSFISNMSDVHTLGITSRWHIIDRYFATCTAVYHFYSLKTRDSLLINLLLFLIGFRYLQQSRHYYNIHSYEFLMAHTKWHCVAPLMALTSDLI